MNGFFMMFFVLFCSHCFSMSKSCSLRDEFWDVVNEYTRKLKKEEGIERRRYGVDCAGPDKIYDAKIHEISLGYSIDKNLQYEEARSLFYKIVNELLQEINSHENLKEELYHFPVTYADLHFSLSFDYENKGGLKKDEVKQIVIRDNEIFYSVVNVDHANTGLVFNETYSGMGTIEHPREDVLRTTLRKLPETEEEVKSSP